MRSASRRRRRSRPPEERSKSCDEQAVPSHSEYFQHAGLADPRAVYAGHAGGVSPGRAHSHAGNQYGAVTGHVPEGPRLGSGTDRPLQRRQPAPADDFCAGHHAVHYGFDYFAVDGGGVALPGAFAEGRRAGAAEDYAVHALPDDYFELVSVVHDREDLAAAEHEWRSAGVSPRCAIYPDDHADADHGIGVHHVVGRADQRTWHRKWNVADHFRGHRGGIAERGARFVFEDDQR